MSKKFSDVVQRIELKETEPDDIMTGRKEWDMDLDFIKLKSALKEAIVESVSKLRRAHPDEHFYAFALYTSGEVNHFVLTANSEEGLRRKAESEARKRRSPLDLEASSLRWSPCDWAYHLAYQDSFEAVNALLGKLDLDAGLKLEKLDELMEEVDTILESCKEVLKDLDANGFFGSGKPRQKLTLAILMGDQSNEERIRIVKSLNDGKTLSRFKNEVGKGTEAFFKLSESFPRH